MLIHYLKNTLYKDRFLRITWTWLLVLSINSPLAYATGEYLLGDGDTVSITVYDHPDLTLTARISPEGTIPYPLLEEVAIGGLTPKAAGRKIAKMLVDRGFIISPQVALAVKDYTSQQIHILGKVSNPGNYPLEGEGTVVDLLARAGGVILPLPGFGSSDCRCLSHLFFYKSKPSGSHFRRKIRKKFKDHARFMIEKSENFLDN